MSRSNFLTGARISVAAAAVAAFGRALLGRGLEIVVQGRPWAEVLLYEKVK